MTIKELQTKLREKHDALAVTDDKLNNFDRTLMQRELTDDEKKNREKAENERKVQLREYQAAQRELSEAMSEAQARELNKTPEKSANQRFREILHDIKEGKRSRELILGGDSGVQASGAVDLTINDIIPTLNEGTNLPAGATIVTGVTGNEVWPVSADDVEITERGELAALKDQTLSFDKVTVSPKSVGLRVDISNGAIEDSHFDLIAYVQKKFKLAAAKYVAEKLYSQAAWDGNKGPFSGLTAAGTITLDTTSFKALLKAVAKLTDLGYNASQVCFIMDASTEADLKGTPKAAGQGGFVIEDGKCAGYDYVVSHYINTTFNGDKSALQSTADRFIGVGLFSYEAIQQHGDVRLTVDSTSAEAASKDATIIILNTRFSFTDLSAKVTTNGKKNNATTAFALYKVAEPAAAGAGDGN